MTLSDTDRMPFGKYSDRTMEKVPSSYLIWLWNDGLHSSARSEAQIAVRDYIIESMGALEKDCPDAIITNDPRKK